MSKGVLVFIFAVQMVSAQLAYSQQPAPDSGTASVKFENFAALRGDLLTAIAGATNRILLTSDFLTDADIVSSLYIAQYRKVHIHVLLGRDKASNVMSRLSYLKQVNITTGIRPRNFFGQYPSLAAIDSQLFAYSTTFDYLTKTKPITKASLTIDQLKTYETVFSAATSVNADIPEQKPLPQVGRPRKPVRTSPISDRLSGKPIQTGDTSIQKVPDQGPPNSNPPPSSADLPAARPGGKTLSNGSYRYKAVKDAPDRGIPTKLPKTTIYQRRQQERAQGEMGATEAPAAASSQ